MAVQWNAEHVNERSNTSCGPIIVYFYKLLFGWRVVSLALMPHLPILTSIKATAISMSLE